MSQALTHRFERIEQTMARRGLALGPKASEEAVARFEAESSIVLPETYRRFLLEVGDGGKGPPAYGVDPLDKIPVEYAWDRSTTLEGVSQKFPFTKDVVWEDLEAGDDVDEGDEDSEAEDADFGEQDDEPTPGFLPLGTDGCGAFYGLVVTGPERGNVWLIDGNGAFRQGEFVEWWEDWLGCAKADDKPADRSLDTKPDPPIEQDTVSAAVPAPRRYTLSERGNAERAAAAAQRALVEMRLEDALSDAKRALDHPAVLPLAKYLIVLAEWELGHEDVARAMLRELVAAYLDPTEVPRPGRRARDVVDRRGLINAIRKIEGKQAAALVAQVKALPKQGGGGDGDDQSW